MTDPKSLEDLSAEVLEKFWGRTALSKPPSAKSIILDALRLARRSGLEMAAEIVENPRYCGCKDYLYCETCYWILCERQRCACEIRAKAKEIE